VIDADTRNGIGSRRRVVFLGGGAAVWSASSRTVNLTAGMITVKGSVGESGSGWQWQIGGQQREGPLSRVALVPLNRR
jgi:hypothetical protein